MKKQVLGKANNTNRTLNMKNKSHKCIIHIH